MTDSNSFGLIFAAIVVLLLAGGIVLLVLSIRSTIRKKKRIGGIVGGGIMIVCSVFAGFMALFLLLVNTVSDEVNNDRTIQLAAGSIKTAIELHDAKRMTGLLASKSYSGDEIEAEDVEALIDYIDGFADDISFSVNSIKKKNSTRCVTIKFTIETTEGHYTLYVDYITNASNDSYLGIQHLELKDRGGKLCEFGEEPDLD